MAAEEAQNDYLSDILDDRVFIQTQGWGELGINAAVKPTDGREPMPLRIKDTTYDKGLGHHAPGEIVVDLSGDYASFLADVGIQWQGGNTAGSVEFKVYIDSDLRYDSGVVREQDAPRKVEVSLAGADTLRLVVTDAGDGITCDCADWADARLVRVNPPKERGAQEQIDVAMFARVITCDPHRTEGAHSNRVQEFRAEDVFLETPVRPRDGLYEAPREPDGLRCIGLQWAETRPVRELEIEFAKYIPMPPVDGVRVEYWTGESPWQGNWKTLNGTIAVDGNRWMLPVSRKETPEFPRMGIDKVRWIFSSGPLPIAVKKLSAFTRARLDSAALRVELETPRPGEKGFIEIYNGLFTEGADADNPLRHAWDLGASTQLKLQFTKPRPWKSDRTVLRIALPNGGCGVAVEDVIKSGCVYVRDLGLYVAPATAAQTAREYHDSVKERKTVLERVREMPDQTFTQAMEKAHNPIQDLGPMMLSLACDNRKVVAHRDGTIQFTPYGDEPVDKKGGFAPSHRLIPHFGSGKNEHSQRHLRGDWLPAPEIAVRDGGVVYHQCAFVAPSGEPLATAPLWLNNRPLSVTEFRIENPGERPANARLFLSLCEGEKKCPPARSQVQLGNEPEGGVIFARAGYLIAFVDARQAGAITCSAENEGITLSGTLAPHGEARCYVYIPLWRVKADEFKPAGSPERHYENLQAYWNSALAGAMQVEIPEPALANVIRASQVHCLLAARNEQDGRDVAAWIASDRYGPLESEAHSLILGMDLMGQEEFARRSLDFFIKRYNAQGFLTTGYTLMGTGWHLWTLARHYELTADEAWLEKVAPNVSQVCQWIAAQLEKTRPAGDTDQCPELGLMPPGVGADWNRFAYRFAVQGHFCAGLRDAARALSAIRYPSAPRLLEMAGTFRGDLLRAYKWNQLRTPAWPLSNGTFVPAYSGMLYCFGETGEMIPGEDGNRSWAYDVELGAHHLIPLGIIDAQSADADEIINHMEDFWFLHGGMGDYPEEKNHEDWFNLGGFSKVQPYYTRNAEICAARDDVKPFIRSYFNAMASLLSTENLSFWEHFHNTGAWNKTHETGWFLVQTRTMYVMERGNELWLAPFVPNYWLDDGETVAVRNAPTKFGAVSYRITPAIGKGWIEAEINPPTRTQPEATVIRLRHPQGLSMRAVSVNGSPHTDFDPAKEFVRVKAAPGPISIRADY
jgi:hypothetical protein